MSLFTKRQFLKTITGASAFLFADLKNALAQVSHLTAAELAQKEDFWLTIRKSYTITKDFTHLENGYFSLAADPVLQKYLNHIRQVNRVSSYYMRTRMTEDKQMAGKALAQLLKCLPDELIITRNTTEALDTVIGGFPWKTGDEAIMAEQDYGAMLDMFALQARRYGIVNRQVSLPNHPASDEEIVQLYEKAITPQTRLLLVSHVVNITGQVLPVQKIVEMAHRYGVEVLVDGAHAFGQLDFAISQLGCDYYGSSLHKWLGNPLGAGILYVRKDKIAKIWPMFADAGFADDDIRKLNHTGTHPVATDLAIVDAIAFHQLIGIQRKQARLRYLQQYWTSQVRKHPGIVLNTPHEEKRTCAIANVGVNGISPTDLAKRLLEQYKIFTVAIDRPGVAGVRVTPHLYTTTQELDALVKALLEIAG